MNGNWTFDDGELATEDQLQWVNPSALSNSDYAYGLIDGNGQLYVYYDSGSYHTVCETKAYSMF